MAYPFKIQPNGRPALVEFGSDEWGAQHIYAYLMTILGERHLAPNYGTEDLLFQPEINAGELLVSFIEFYPDIEIDEIDFAPGEGGSQSIDVKFRVVEAVNEDG